MKSLSYFTISLILYLLPGLAWTFETLPEYQSLNEDESQSLQKISLIDSEYESDRHTYMHPFSWQHRWLSSPNDLEISNGSLSGTRFLTDTRLKIKKQLSEDVAFRFVFFDKGDHESKTQHQIIEFEYAFTKKISILLLGELLTKKREDDIGVAFVYNLSANHQVKFFYTMVDYSRNRRNDDQDRFTKSPKNFGFVERLWSNAGGDSNSFFQISARQESQLRWTFSSQDFNYIYSKVVYSVLVRNKLHTSNYFNIGLEHTKNEEAIDPISNPSSVTPARQENQRLSFLLQKECDGFNWSPKNTNLIYGIRYVTREFNTLDGDVRHSNVLPHITLEFLNYASRRIDKWSLGYEFTWHRGSGPTSLRSSRDQNNRIEHRANLGYEFRLLEGAVLRFIATLDLDKFGGEETWEGGAGQLNFSF